MSGPRETELTRLFPCLHVLRAAGIAIEPRKLLLGMIGLFLLAAGFRAFALLPFAPESPNLAYGRTPADWLHAAARESHLSVTGSALSEPLDFGAKLLRNPAARLLLAPAVTVLEPATALFGSKQDVRSIAWNVTLLLWSLIVWSIIGGALARMTAMQFAKRERISIREAVRFSGRQALSYLVAPGLPLAGVGVLIVVNIVLALIGSVPVAGGPVLGALWGLVLLTSFLMTMLLVGIVAGWPLMIAAISTEDSDGFDGLSRSYAFLLDRPWYTLLLAGVGLAGGLMGWFVLNVLMELTVHLASFSVSSGYVGESELRLPLSGTAAFQATGAASTAEYLISGWMTLFSGLLAGFGPSFFFCAFTVIYFLVRKSDDGTELGQVAVFLESTPHASGEDSEPSDSPTADAPEASSPDADSESD